MTRLRVALATAAEVPDLDEEGRLLVDALVAEGLEAAPAVWDDADVDWAAYDLVVVRSTWDYPDRPAEFLAWAERVASSTRLENSLAHLRLSTDKHYLQVLARAGVPVVPSHFVEPGDDAAHPYLDREHVVKPAVSAGSRGTLRLGEDEVARSLAHVRDLQAAGRSVLVQPYLPEVDTAGETAVVFLGGEVSHAIRKGPLLERGAGLVEDLFAQEEITPREPSAAEVAVAEQTLAVLAAEVPRPTTYARVDLLPTAEGPLVLELELAEPSLFLDHADGAARRLAAVVRERAGGGVGGDA